MTTLFKATNKKIGPTLTPHYLRRIKKGAHLDELESDALVVARPIVIKTKDTSTAISIAIANY